MRHHIHGDAPQAVADAVFAAAAAHGYLIAGAAVLVREAVPELAAWSLQAEWERQRRQPTHGKPTACDPELCGIMGGADGPCDYCPEHAPTPTPEEVAREERDQRLRDRQFRQWHRRFMTPEQRRRDVRREKQERRQEYQERLERRMEDAARRVLVSDLPDAVAVVQAQQKKGGRKWSAA
jgi:hypothetical protein